MVKIYKIKTNAGNEYVAEVVNEGCNGCWVAHPLIADELNGMCIKDAIDEFDWTNWGEFVPDVRINDLFNNLDGYGCDDPQIVCKWVVPGTNY